MHLYLASRPVKRIDGPKEAKGTARDMFDTMTLTKIGGGLSAALLAILLASWATESIYLSGQPADGVQGYVVDTGDDDAPAEPVEEGPSFDEVYASADPAAGQTAYRPCAACHSVDPGENKTGPSLHGVVGRAPGTEEGFSYSSGFADLNDAWTPAELEAFIEAPRTYDPNTKMTYAGMRSIQDRADLIAYLATLTD